MEFEKREIEIIRSQDLCRISTNGIDGWPHTVPVSFTFTNNTFYIPATPDSRKVRNLRKDPRCTIVIDDEDDESGIMMECRANLIDGEKSEEIKKIMREKFGWKNDSSTQILELTPLRKFSWLLE